MVMRSAALRRLPQFSTDLDDECCAWNSALEEKLIRAGLLPDSTGHLMPVFQHVAVGKSTPESSVFFVSLAPVVQFCRLCCSCDRSILLFRQHSRYGGVWNHKFSYPEGVRNNVKSGIIISALVLLLPVSVQAGADGDATTKLVSELGRTVVQVDSGHDLSSGVLISRDGHVLTVAHGLKEQQTRVTIRLDGGKTRAAKVVSQNRSRDVALLKTIAEAGEVFPSVSSSKSGPIDGKQSLAFGFPARDGTTGASVVRLGKIVSHDARTIRSRCVLTAGDSGGPLFAVDGTLLGIHQRIGADRSVNLHLSISACSEALNPAFDIRKLTVAVTPFIDESRDFTISAAVASLMRSRTVEIVDSKSNVVARGTIVNSKMVVTKLSLLNPNEVVRVRTTDGEFFDVDRGQNSLPNDLAVLRVTGDSSWVDLPVIHAGDPESGNLVAGGTGDANAQFGIITRVAHNEEAVRPRLGCTVATISGSLVVEQISPDGAAADAHLQPEDKLLSISKHPTTQLPDVFDALRMYQPGDWVEFLFERNGQALVAFGQLRHPASGLLKRSEYLDGRSGELSRRRTSFSGMIQHDLPLAPSEMGGPLFSCTGELIGVNIARRARESVLAVPISVVMQLVESRAKSDSSGFHGD